MNLLLTNAKFTTLSLFFLVFFTLNSFICHSEIIGFFLLLYFLGLIAPKLGQLIFPQENHLFQFLTGFFTLLSGLAITGSIFYYLTSFTSTVAITIVFVLPSLTWLAWQRHYKKIKTENKFSEKNNLWLEETDKKTPLFFIITTVVALSFFVISFFLLRTAATETSLRSPWEVVPPIIFLIFALGTLLTCSLLIRGKKRWLSIPLSIVMLLVFFSVALLVYPLGYGFDSFIHQATENHIATFGTITPKPFYYIGQYALVLFFHYTFLLPIVEIDKFLLPVLAAIMLPLAWLIAAAHIFQNKQKAVQSLIGLFLLPLSSFIVTTPQNLGNLWFVIIILLSTIQLLERKRTVFWPLGLGAVATVLIHPIAGLPILFFIILLLTNPQNNYQKFPRLARIFFWFTASVGCLIVPFSFVINSWKNNQAWNLNFSALWPSNLFANLPINLFLENRFSSLFDLIYLFGWNQLILLGLLAIIGLVLSKKAGKNLKIFFLFAFILGSNYLLTKTALNFDFLIDYERGNYADRLIPLIIFTLGPLIIFSFGIFLEKVNIQPFSLRLTSLLILTVFIVTNFYLSYPRNDAYETSHGYSLGQADLSAVLDIERDAADAPYVALANQTIAAAAVKEFGFSRYWGEQYFYPIPTGGTLYRLFLEMNKNPTKETAIAAMDLVGVDKIYYLVSDYWWQAERLRETAKTNADDWWSVENGKVMIFEYNR